MPGLHDVPPRKGRGLSPRSRNKKKIELTESNKNDAAHEAWMTNHFGPYLEVRQSDGRARPCVDMSVDATLTSGFEAQEVRGMY